MPRIASHHQPGHPLRSTDEYTPTQAWPDDTTVQWGSNGLVLSKSSYFTSFFEAFPANGGFIRGEGETITDAEKAAFLQWQKENTCQHEWSRRGYTNGGGICRHCGAFKGSIFPPLTELGKWRKPPDYNDLDTIIKGWLRLFPHRNTASLRKYSRRTFLKARRAGIHLPQTPSKPMTDDEFMRRVPDPYREACQDAVETWLNTQPEHLSEIETKHLKDQITRARNQGSPKAG